MVHRRALEAANALFRTEGEPSSGAVFCAAKRPFGPLSESAVADIVGKAATLAGFPPLDLRHLRGPLGLWLQHRGWDELRVSRAFGYERVREFRALVRPLEEANAQIETREFLVLPEPERKSASRSPAQTSGTDPDSRSSRQLQVAAPLVQKAWELDARTLRNDGE